MHREQLQGFGPPAVAYDYRSAGEIDVKVPSDYYMIVVPGPQIWVPLIIGSGVY